MHLFHRLRRHVGDGFDPNQLALEDLRKLKNELNDLTSHIQGANLNLGFMIAEGAPLTKIKESRETLLHHLEEIEKILKIDTDAVEHAIHAERKAMHSEEHVTVNVVSKFFKEGDSRKIILFSHFNGDNNISHHSLVGAPCTLTIEHKTGGYFLESIKVRSDIDISIKRMGGEIIRIPASSERTFHDLFLPFKVGIPKHGARGNPLVWFNLLPK